MFRNKTLLITGGTGSFGNAVLKRFLHTDINEIRVFSRDEKKQEDMRIKLNNPKVKYYIGDVRNYDSIKFAMYGVDYVFHAAALKQVPSCEFYPMEAVRTNILGAENVLNASLAADVKKVIILSTDKAVYPINAMGISKAMMEKLMVAKAMALGARCSTLFCGTRYGNVMASRGSVIPLFIKQIKEGRTLTVTDPNMTRFLMSLNDAVNLVVYAFQHGKQGDRFVQKAPASTIRDLAMALVEIFDANNKVRIIGTRHGEKLHETLLTREEYAYAEDLGGYYRIVPDGRDLNYDKYFTEGEEQLSKSEDYNSCNTQRLSIVEVKEKLLQLEYVRQELEVDRMMDQGRIKTVEVSKDRRKTESLEPR
ncbi:polysaccharide biosynthesis protein [Planctomycetota bacterium]